jgi:hypothetical protein
MATRLGQLLLLVALAPLVAALQPPLGAAARLSIELGGELVLQVSETN